MRCYATKQVMAPVRKCLLSEEDHKLLIECARHAPPSKLRIRDPLVWNLVSTRISISTHVILVRKRRHFREMTSIDCDLLSLRLWQGNAVELTWTHSNTIKYVCTI